jgi:hemolysin activation/secretion protein
VHEKRKKRHAMFTMALVGLLVGSTAHLRAQSALPSAATERLSLPSFGPPPAERGSVLPQADLSSPLAQGFAAGSQTVFVRKLVISGNTVLPQAELTRVGDRFVGRDVSFAELVELRDAITKLYIDRGYLTSGALTPVLAEDDGVVQIDVVEGALSAIAVNTDGWLRERYVRNYLASFGPFDPVNVFNIERRLQVLQAEPGVRRVDARLLPGNRRGESILDVRVAEHSQLSVAVDVNNYQSPAIGAGGALVRASLRNLAGRADVLGASVRATEGLREATLAYDLPVNSYGTTVGIHALGARSEIVQPPFDHLGIEAKARTFGVSVAHPIERSPTTSANAFLTAEMRRTESFLLGSGFSFTAGPDEGVARVAVVRVGVERTMRGMRDVLAGRATLSFGLDALNATIKPGNTPDGRFTAFLGQLQWAHRLDWLKSQLVGRLDVQLADSALLGMEQIAIGGRSSVRGYHEDTLVRDSGAIGSVELRVPLLRRPTGAAALEIAPFVDWSYSWNVRRDEIGPLSLGSAGLGLRWSPLDRLLVDLSWGHAFKDLDYAGTNALQDHGFHLGMSYGM